MRLTETQIREISWALASYGQKLPGTAQSRRSAYARYGDYYDGRHKLTFASEKFKSTFGDTFQALSENLCPAVVDGLASQLQLQSVIPGGEFGASEEARIQAVVDEVQRVNRFDVLEGQVHRDTFVNGDAYLIVWPDEESRPILYPNRAGSVTVDYHPEKLGYIVRAAKWFRENGRVRLNLYYRDRIEKYITTEPYSDLPVSAMAFMPHMIDDEDWPLQNPYDKVPVFHFANNAGVGEMGTSELHDIIPLQDALNKSLCDMLVAMELEAFAQRWVTGLEPRYDDEGNPISPFQAGIDRILMAEDADVRFGEFSRADLAQYVSVQDSLRAAVARVAGFPPHYFMLQDGVPPSGESLRIASARITAKIMARQKTFGNRWEDVFRFALKIAGYDDVKTVATWDDPTPALGEKEVWEVAMLQRDAGVSREQVLIERGYTREQARLFQQANFDDDFGDGALPSGGRDE